MRRREKPAGAVSAADGVFWWTRYPSLAMDHAEHEAAVDAWSEEFEGWCELNGVDSDEVTNEAARQGLTDQPFDASWL